MEEMLARMWNGLVARVGGPMTFRVILQPSMATLLAILAGLKDAREGRPPYLWTILTDPSQRAGLIREGWKACASVKDVPVRPDTITVYLAPPRVLKVLPDIAARGCDELFLNPGTASPEVLAECARLGLKPIQACSIIAVGVSPAQL